MKNWTGNKNSTFSTLGASNHSSYERADNDFYATDPVAVKELYNNFWEEVLLGNVVWECAAGNGHLIKGLHKVAPHIDVYSSDIVEREFKLDKIINFLKVKKEQAPTFNTILTNPPYRYAQEFVEKSMELSDNGNSVAMFLKLTFLEGQKRKKMFEKYPPKYVLVFSKRIQVARNGDEEMFKKSSAAAYAWFVWKKGYNGDPIIKWI